MDLTVVLVGPTGHGKSAIGNRILGREAFQSRTYWTWKNCNRYSVVTETCELQTTVLEDGRTISVIDTPGFLDTESELLGEEVEKCIHLARNKIHAIIFVASFGYRFSKQDQIVAVRNLQIIFGKNILNYIIEVVTGGDELEKLVHHPRNAFEQEFFRLCEDRSVHFNNWIEDEVKRYEEVQNLLSKVKTVISQNGGEPFMSQVFDFQLQGALRLRDNIAEAQAATLTVDEGAKGYLKEEILEQIDKSFEERMTLITDVVEARLRYTTRLEQQMDPATLKANKRAEKYLKEETSDLIKRISKSYEEQMTQRLEAVEQRVLDMATRFEQQLAEAHAAQMRVNEIAQCEISELIQQMTQRINEAFNTGFNPLYAILKENKLTGPNYIDWKRNLDIVLTAGEYKFCTYEECPPKAEDSDSDEVKDYYKKWKKADEMTRCYILASMSGVLQHQHQAMQSASDMLYNLNKLFGSHKRAGRQVAMKALMNTTMTEGTPVRDHVLKMMAHLNELESRGAEIDGETQIDIILMSLPDSFNQFRLNYNMNERLYGIAELLTELQAVESLFHQHRVNVAEKGSSYIPKWKNK